jgi:diguanylate cyclase (GGDEF)-like protein/PAS domain S-box-containing protein
MREKKNTLFSELRDKAEELVQENSGDSGEFVRLKLDELIHELQVHQIELEMQNDELQQSREHLEISRNKYQELFENAPMGYLVVDPSGVVVDGNTAALEMLGLPRHMLVGMHFTMFLDGDHRKDYLRHLKKVLQDNSRDMVEITAINPRTGPVDIQIHSAPILDEADTRLSCLSAFIDITERKLMEEELRRSEERYRTVADYTWDWENWISPEGRPFYVSPSCRRICGYPPETFLENPEFLVSIIHEEDLGRWKKFMNRKNVRDAVSLDYRIRHKDGGVRWVSQVNRRVHRDGRDLGLRFSIRDITDRKHMEIQLRFQALHDPLTGLPNRTLCRDRIRLALERANRREKYFYAVVFLDMDRFKQVNDNLGHEAGDKFLVEVGKRLLGCVRGLDTVSRFGGDEFVILLEELTNLKEANLIVKRVREALRKTFRINGSEINSSGSLGMALGSSRQDDPDELIRKANVAMHKAKESGRDCFKVFNSRMEKEISRLADFGKQMRDGLNQEEFFLEFLPIVTLSDLYIVGFETLARWNHPGKGLINPLEFIPVAEETGLIEDLDSMVLKQALNAGKSWRNEIGRSAPLIVTVNLSRRQLYNPTLAATIKSTLRSTGFPPELLCLEASESAVTENEQEALERLSSLKDLGVILALDDFGIKAWSINSLRRFPFSLLKVDMSLSERIHLGSENYDHVKAIIELAHNLDMEVVAEGVSEKQHLELLREMGCDYGQGFHVSRPMPVENVPPFIRNGVAGAA